MRTTQTRMVARAVGRAVAAAGDDDTVSGIIAVGEEYCQAMSEHDPTFNKDEFMRMVDAFHAVRVIELTHMSAARHPSMRPNLKVVDDGQNLL